MSHSVLVYIIDLNRVTQHCPSFYTLKNRTIATEARPPRICTKIGELELFLKFRLSLARALSSDTSLELTYRC